MHKILQSANQTSASYFIMPYREGMERSFRISVLPNVGGTEQGDTRKKPISLFKEIIKINDDDTSKEMLKHDQNWLRYGQFAQDSWN